MKNSLVIATGSHQISRLDGGGEVRHLMYQYCTHLGRALGETVCGWRNFLPDGCYGLIGCSTT